MNRPRLYSRSFETPRNAIGSMFCSGENEHGIELGIVQEMQKKRRLQMRLHFENKLRDRFRRIRAAADLDHFRRTLEFVG
jgi:hypothetical protein